MTATARRIALSWVSAGLLIAAPAVFVGWLVWVIFTIRVCPVLDIRMFGGPTVALLFATAGTASAAVMLSRRATALGVVFLTLGVLECVGFGLEVLQALFCIPAPP